MLLKQLSEAMGVSSREGEVRDLLRDYLASSVERMETDRLGNLYCYKNWDAGSPRVVITAHMDEVGLMVTKIEKEGFLRFQPVGSIDPRVLVSKPVVVGLQKVPGVIGAKPIHLQEPDERKKALEYKDLYIDLGVNSDEEAKKLVSLGDLICFPTQCEDLPDGVVKGKAFDDRAGCYVLAEVLRQTQTSAGVVGVFTVQEEVGIRGAEVVGNTLRPDLAIVLEGTTAADVPEIEEHCQCTKLGGGPALTLMDRLVLAHRPTVQLLTRLADQLGLPVQFKRSAAGGTEGGALERGHTGVPTVVISVPCRYIHSPVGLVSRHDLAATIKLVLALLDYLHKEGVPA